MLTQDDINWIKMNRSDLTAGRTESVTLIHTSTTGNDPYTGEATTSETQEVVSVIWKEYSTVSNGDRSVVGGVEIQQDDVQISVDSAVDLSDVTEVIRGDVSYTIITIDENGIGEANRYECVVRRTS